MKLPTAPLGATLESFTSYIRTLVNSIQSGWGKEHNADGSHNFPWVDVDYNAAYFTCDDGTWTPDKADVTTYAYVLFGSTMTLAFSISTSTLSATPDILFIRIPDGYTAVRTTVNTCRVQDNGTERLGLVYVTPGDASIRVQMIDMATEALASFSAATNTTTVQGQLTFEVEKE